MSRLIYASEMICERPRIWYLAVGANMTIDQSVPGVRKLGERFRHHPVQGLIVDYRAATIRQHPFEYSELALSVSLHIPPTTLNRLHHRTTELPESRPDGQTASGPQFRGTRLSALGQIDRLAELSARPDGSHPQQVAQYGDCLGLKLRVGRFGLMSRAIR
jgi:hypothetical protein